MTSAAGTIIDVASSCTVRTSGISIDSSFLVGVVLALVEGRAALAAALLLEQHLFLAVLLRLELLARLAPAAAGAPAGGTGRGRGALAGRERTAAGTLGAAERTRRAARCGTAGDRAEGTVTGRPPALRRRTRGAGRGRRAGPDAAAGTGRVRLGRGAVRRRDGPGSGRCRRPERRAAEPAAVAGAPMPARRGRAAAGDGLVRRTGRSGGIGPGWTGRGGDAGTRRGAAPSGASGSARRRAAAGARRGAGADGALRTGRSCGTGAAPARSARRPGRLRGGRQGDRQRLRRPGGCLGRGYGLGGDAGRGLRGDRRLGGRRSSAPPDAARSGCRRGLRGGLRPFELCAEEVGDLRLDDAELVLRLETQPPEEGEQVFRRHAELFRRARKSWVYRLPCSPSKIWRPRAPSAVKSFCMSSVIRSVPAPSPGVTIVPELRH